MSVKNKIHLMSFEDLFTTQAERDDAKLERVREVPVAELHPFPSTPLCCGTMRRWPAWWRASARWG